LTNEIKKLVKRIESGYSSLNLNEALKGILHISSLGNKYFQENEPWKLINKDREKTHEILGLCVNIVKNLSILIQPVLPEFSLKLQQQLNVSGLKWKDINFELKNHKIGKEEILVSKMEQKETKPQFQLNLKVARILGIKEHPNADKLYVLDIDLGNEKRQLVAGIKGYYSADELKNKKIVVITNLKHAKLRGVESQGMLLAGDDGSGPGLLTVERSNAGDKVYFDGFEIGNEQVTYEEFAKISMIVKNSKVTFEGKELKTDKEIVKVERTKDGGRVR